MFQPYAAQNVIFSNIFFFQFGLLPSDIYVKDHLDQKVLPYSTPTPPPPQKKKKTIPHYPGILPNLKSILRLPNLHVVPLL